MRSQPRQARLKGRTTRQTGEETEVPPLGEGRDSGYLPMIRADQTTNVYGDCTNTGGRRGVVVDLSGPSAQELYATVPP